MRNKSTIVPILGVLRLATIPSGLVVKKSSFSSPLAHEGVFAADSGGARALRPVTAEGFDKG